MNLLGDFCTILRKSGEETEFEYLLSLNKEHFIYRSHFPGNPVTPGVCIIQLGKELTEHHLNTPLTLTRIVNVKFLSVINPLVHDTVHAKFTLVQHDETGYKLHVTMGREETLFAKMTLYLQRNRIT
ncbi:MAG: hydroxymyristoyl-ACP dehydratase [Dysgonamonadaceae bacterium]|jgi:3-hydroxyacyl-[acyl-carrier-protein] dehydratase|nr:hydroxymyristoyl-ACP dehydratase [Dysgonamonadaceae bacterium]